MGSRAGGPSLPLSEAGAGGRAAADEGLIAGAEGSAGTSVSEMAVGDSCVSRRAYLVKPLTHPREVACHRPSLLEHLEERVLV